MASSFAKGDLVHLKSGSPTMTVTSVSPEYDLATLARYDDGKVITESICPDALVSVTEVPATKPMLCIFVEGAPALEITSEEVVTIDKVLLEQPGVSQLVERAICIVEDTCRVAATARPSDAEAFGLAVLSQLPADREGGHSA